MPQPRSQRKPKSAPVVRQPDGVIRVRGARQNNLDGIDLDVPLHQLTVVTGPSGSGKSSLAFQTIYAEGQRRYVETFSPYTRQFFDRMDKPLVDEIHGIPPAIAIEQNNNVRTTRSTVGTITEINDYLKLLFPRIATAFCPGCRAEVRPETAESITAESLNRFKGRAVLVTFGVSVPAKTKPAEFFGFLQQQGYLRIWVYGKVYRIDDPNAYARKALPAVVPVIQDRIEATAANRPRLLEAVEAALKYGKGQVTVVDQEARESASFSRDWHCADCGISIHPPSPGLFSFNNPLGACPSCRGFGRTIGIDLERAIPNPGLSIAEGAVKAFQGETHSECQADLQRHAKRRGIDGDAPFEELPKRERDWILYGEQGRGGDAEESWRNDEWYGVQGFFDWLESKAYKMHVRVFLSRYRSYTVCRDCDGSRLQPESLNYRWVERDSGGMEKASYTLPDWWQLPVTELAPMVRGLPLPAGDTTTEMLRTEIHSRLRYLERVGLGYLNLDRSSRTLSGGEMQRVNLTTCLGASLVNTLFVMDEPSIGLHPRDVGRLNEVMHGLRDKGNTLLVVEHEEAVIREADNIIELGPGRGEHGGKLVYSGNLAGLLKTREGASLTADYLGGKRAIAAPSSRRAPAGFFKIQGARQNNLKKIDVRFPLGVLCCVSGVSGSGKSTLVHEVLYRNLLRKKGESTEAEPGRCKGITGFGRIGNVIMVDQSPLSRTPRSTPAVYIGAFDLIRKLFAETPDARAQGMTMGDFSFNSGAGRCERCWGTGFEKIEMQFLSDLYVRCSECEGKRYQPDTLKILLEGKSPFEVLEMTASEAIEFFGAIEIRKAAEIVTSLRLLEEVGLGYLRLGQPLNQLSGGESQRLKLVGHLMQKGQGRARAAEGSRRKSDLLIFDEPTTGLHIDDIATLIAVFKRLVDQGNSLLVIEHNLEVLKCADYLIDLGPEAGAHGGEIVAMGTPEEVARAPASHTGRFLAEALRPARYASAAARAPASRVAEDAAAADSGVDHHEIRIYGAREHNLKDIDIAIPRDQLVVVTGLSGSGKSTLAFDILFAEGQRRFLDSMSPYARQFAEQLEKPDVDHIVGLPPTVAIEQRVTRGGAKSTVATVTEIYHFLRLLFAKTGTQFCPDCAVPVENRSVSSIVTVVRGLARKGAVRLMAPVVKARKGFHTEVARWAEKQGFSQLFVDGQFKAAENFQKLARFKEHSIDVVVAEIKKTAPLAQVRQHVERALKVGRGTARVLDAGNRFVILSSERCCPGCGLAFEELDPRLFSYNSPHGWCPECRGYGQTYRSNSWYDGGDGDSVLEAELREDLRIDRTDATELEDCTACGGSRINATARAVRVQGNTIDAIAALAVREAEAAIGAFRFEGAQKLIAHDMIREILQRLQFLKEVGLGYLALNRSAKTLSGGESQRIRLAAQLGSNLRGVLYVLDEPTIGLHPRDNQALLATLLSLRDCGNSVLVVEHDVDTMRQSDQIIDLGPGAGSRGGRITAQGTLGHLQRDRHSVTGRYLRSPMRHPLKGGRRAVPASNSKHGWLRVRGACANNLRKLNARIPVGRLTAICGISGSGKSSLMRGVLRPAVEAALLSAKKSRGRKRQSGEFWKSIAGVEAIEAVYEVDQSPIGKTSRSTPATYVKLFDEIRKLYAQVPAARVRGYTASRFSFNTEGGRCESCKGNGQIKLEMNFLPTSWVPCEECRGMRYNEATLEIEYSGVNIGRLMQMTIEETAGLFEGHPRIHRTLNLLHDTGLGYLQLGQPSPTLSGGEAQRIKLVTQLTKGIGRSEHARLRQNRKTGSNLYLIEEPSIGLHMADVEKLLEVLHRLVDEGHTVVVIEHNLDIVSEADYVLELGPEAGQEGGQIIASGTPEEVADVEDSRTGPFLKKVLQPADQR